ncbi:MAG TPA: hypothetical protein VMS56_04630 [Thermoanaerobaculia bacterium]|nr:hypothetical protein [Thermoanaerobaculia bacterium]
MKSYRAPHPGPRAPGLHVHRYQWPSDEASGFAETELIYDGEGRLVGIDRRPGGSRPAGLADRRRG